LATALATGFAVDLAGEVRAADLDVVGLFAAAAGLTAPGGFTLASGLALAAGLVVVVVVAFAFADGAAAAAGAFEAGGVLAAGLDFVGAAAATGLLLEGAPAVGLVAAGRCEAWADAAERGSARFADAGAAAFGAGGVTAAGSGSDTTATGAAAPFTAGRGPRSPTRTGSTIRSVSSAWRSGVSAVSRHVKATTSFVSLCRSNRTIAVWLRTVSTMPVEPTG
jgi:hypothetical protein